MRLARLGVTVALAAICALVPALALATPASADYMGSGMAPMGGWSPPMPGMGMLGTMRTGAGPGALPRGCGSPKPTVPAAAISELPRVTVEIYDGLFVPSELTVRPGTVVIFQNRGSQPHTATAWEFWDSGILWPGESCAIWTVTPGTYNFLSIVAADGGRMTGTLTVGGEPIGGTPPAGVPAQPQAPTQPQAPMPGMPRY
ncbi:MAG: cupredoxin domain-containing protein [Chloroflexi bacterium]|nr:cupredoxin domain-containing protein [Chloroflexota bacterium]